MANKLYEESSVRAIAERIRERAATDSTYAVKEMPNGVDAVYSKGYMDGQAAGGSGGGGIIPTGEIKIEENGTYDVTNYASALVEVASSGGSSVHCGTVTVEGGNEGQNVQASVDTTLEFDIGIISDVRSIVLFYADPKGTFELGAGRQYGWYGSTSMNGWFRTNSGAYEPVSVLDAAATNLRYDQTAGTLYASIGQWTNVIRGTYFWVAVTGGDL
jgi:hypothetical protein